MIDVDVAGKLFPNIATLIIQLCSTGVLLLVFKKFLWVPMQEYFAKRANFIESQINEAKEMNEKAKSDALKVRDDIVEKAKAEATAKIDQAQREIEAEKQQAKEEMKEEMVNVAIEIASKIVAKDMNTTKNQEMVEDFVKKVVN